MIGECSSAGRIGSLLVFSDDWGRHPSSCQHLVRNLLDRYPVLWVNTIGTRAPRLDLQTFRRMVEKVSQWGDLKVLSRRKSGSSAGQSGRANNRSEGMHPNLQVAHAKMWPWFARDCDRRLNRWLLSRQLAPLIQKMPQPVVAVTTLPVTADLPDVLPVDRWVYYCVDDFSQWPGLDGDTLRRMDQDMIHRADTLIAVSETLQSMIAEQGRSSSLLTHGVDVDFWSSQRASVLRADGSTRKQEEPRLLTRSSARSERSLLNLAVVREVPENEEPVTAAMVSGITPEKSYCPDRVGSASRTIGEPVAPTIVDGIPGPLIVF